MSDPPHTHDRVSWGGSRYMSCWCAASFLRIDYDILTAGFDIVLPFARASLLWARVRSRWGSKHGH